MKEFLRARVRPRLVALRRAVAGLLFERRYDVKTGTRYSSEELGFEDDERRHYEPAGWLSLRRALPRRAVGADDVFLDYGSGLGRVVLVAAARYPFKRVIGVEASERLNEVAKANIDRNRHRLRCQAVELLPADALDYEVPSDVTIAHFHNPFTGSLFSAVVERLIESVDRHPRRLRIIYNNPTEHERLMATGRVRHVRDARGVLPLLPGPGTPIRVYEVVPGEAARG